jgi:DNA-directed RNA polymerase subunit RPC12/RpoP
MHRSIIEEKIVRKFHQMVEADIGLPDPGLQAWSQTEARLACPHCGGEQTQEQSLDSSEEMPPEGGAPVGEPEMILVVLCMDCGAEFSPPSTVEEMPAQVLVDEALRRRRHLNTLVHVRRARPS